MKYGVPFAEDWDEMLEIIKSYLSGNDNFKDNFYSVYKYIEQYFRIEDEVEVEFSEKDEIDSLCSLLTDFFDAEYEYSLNAKDSMVKEIMEIQECKEHTSTKNRIIGKLNSHLNEKILYLYSL
jgi:hypothetical protein